MKLLVIGGTRFVGRHMVETALARGHEVTLFHRGKTGQASAGVEEVLGDRRGDLSGLANRTWDAVLDTCGYVPAAVEATGRLLAQAVEHYAFVSTISIYRAPAAPGADETSPVNDELEDPATETVDGTTYGPLKVGCERTLEQLLPGRTLILRPGIVAGPYDHTDRFTYWAWRLAKGGEVLVPGPPERPVQFIDARDLAAFAIHALEQRLTGPYNLVGPQQPLTMAGWCAAAGDQAVPRWVDPAKLLALDPELVLERSFPFWVAPADRPLFRLSAAKAMGAGLSYRPLAETTADTLAWLKSRPDSSLAAGPGLDAEQALLRALLAG